MLKQKTTIENSDEHFLNATDEVIDASCAKKNTSTEKAMGSNAKDQTRS